MGADTGGYDAIVITAKTFRAGEREGEGPSELVGASGLKPSAGS
jgi:hypothetical protein